MGYYDPHKDVWHCLSDSSYMNMGINDWWLVVLNANSCSYRHHVAHKDNMVGAFWGHHARKVGGCMWWVHCACIVTQSWLILTFFLPMVIAFTGLFSNYWKTTPPTWWILTFCLTSTCIIPEYHHIGSWDLFRSYAEAGTKRDLSFLCYRLFKSF